MIKVKRTAIADELSSAAELVILCLAGWLFFINRGLTYSEAAACGIIGTFMVLAGLYLGLCILFFSYAFYFTSMPFGTHRVHMCLFQKILVF